LTVGEIVEAKNNTLQIARLLIQIENWAEEIRLGHNLGGRIYLQKNRAKIAPALHEKALSSIVSANTILAIPASNNSPKGTSLISSFFQIIIEG
jgi:hypothetical protein